jgi:hypothetical protein
MEFVVGALVIAILGLTVLIGKALEAVSRFGIDGSGRDDD